MQKNAQKVEWKTRSKISCHYTWLLHGKICPSWHFLRSLLLQASPVELQSLQQTEKNRRKRKSEFFFSKIEKPKDVGHLISVHARAKMSSNAMVVAKRANCCVANAFSTILKLIWPTSSLETTKMSRKRIFGKKRHQSMGKINCILM